MTFGPLVVRAIEQIHKDEAMYLTDVRDLRLALLGWLEVRYTRREALNLTHAEAAHLAFVKYLLVKINETLMPNSQQMKMATGPNPKVTCGQLLLSTGQAYELEQIWRHIHEGRVYEI